MKLNKKNIRQEKIAKMFYEMGMDVNLISRVSGVESERLNRVIKRNKYANKDIDNI